jgi:DNA-binding response OmpR family regulator
MGLPKILIADDDASVRKALSFILESSGFPFVQAVDGEDGYEKAVAYHPDLVISDLMMPRLNGIQFYKKLRARIDFRDIPFIFLTSIDDPRLKDMGRAIGVTEYLTKPIRGARLLEAITSIVPGSRAEAGLLGAEEQIPDFRISCPQCTQDFSFRDATWCDCSHPVPTKVCPFCFQCLCGRPAEEKKAFWSHLPSQFLKGITRVGGKR